MIEEAIYNKRFNDIEKRKQLWKILVKDFFQQYVKNTDTVLDLACGYGEFINEIQCKKKYGLDINPTSKKHLQKKVTFLETVSTKIPLKDSSVDCIFTSNFFEHITHEQIIATVIECKRVLKKGGEMLILQPNIRFCSKDYWMFFDHITAIDDRAITELFISLNFSHKKTIERFLPYTTKSSLPSTDFFVKTYLRIPLLWKFFGSQSFLYYEKQ